MSMHRDAHFVNFVLEDEAPEPANRSFRPLSHGELAATGGGMIIHGVEELADRSAATDEAPERAEGGIIVQSVVPSGI